jgi:hypothetical protein
VTFLEGLIRSYWPNQRTRVERLASGGWRASVDYSEKDIEFAVQGLRDGRPSLRELARPLELTPRRRRRLHWGRRH